LTGFFFLPVKTQKAENVHLVCMRIIDYDIFKNDNTKIIEYFLDINPLLL